MHSYYLVITTLRGTYWDICKRDDILIFLVSIVKFYMHFIDHLSKVYVILLNYMLIFVLEENAKPERCCLYSKIKPSSYSRLGYFAATPEQLRSVRIFSTVFKGLWLCLYFWLRVIFYLQFWFHAILVGHGKLLDLIFLISEVSTKA